MKSGYHKITIKVFENGFAVKVGCKDLVFETREKLFKALRDYFNDPDAARKKYVPRKEDWRLAACYQQPENRDNEVTVNTQNLLRNVWLKSLSEGLTNDQ